MIVSIESGEDGLQIVFDQLLDLVARESAEVLADQEDFLRSVGVSIQNDDGCLGVKSSLLNVLVS